jgi:methylenetetrahydrofolate reductase (NADPH)
VQKSFRTSVLDPNQFVITLELVPGPQSSGQSVNTLKAIAEDALKDGRISAVSITDNPGGNPSLSPDALGREILDLGMDVIVHCTCRDLNRAGLESRLLQLARMGMENILALTGDYSGKGFGGQGSPVFDLDSVTLICLLHALNERRGFRRPAVIKAGHEGFFVGCAVSPFKSTEAECFTQYSKLRLKAGVCADFIITQLGYDARKFQELLQMQRLLGVELPVLGTVYVLTPRAAYSIYSGKVPGAVVTRPLLDRVIAEGIDEATARGSAIERSARLAAVLKGLGYRGIHLSGIYRSFKIVDKVVSRLGEIGDRWQEFLPEFDLPQPNGFYIFEKARDGNCLSTDLIAPRRGRCGPLEKAHFQALRALHELFFRLDAPPAPIYRNLAALFDRSPLGRFLVRAVEDPAKALLLSCKRCGDCVIEHLAFLCPESKCPKYLRNGPCGGSLEGQCEVYPDRPCVWVRSYNRLASVDQADSLGTRCVPPRMWELNGSSSWLNFFLGRDHQTLPCEIARLFEPNPCPLNRRDNPEI